MGVKKIIIPIAIATAVACGVGYYSYNTVKAGDLSSTTTSSSSLSSTGVSNENAGAINNNVSDSKTNSVVSTNNSNTVSKVDSTNGSNSDTSSKTTSNATGNTQNNSTKDIQSTSGDTSGNTTSSSGIASSTGTTNNTNGTTSNNGGSSSNTNSQILSNLKEKYLNQLAEVNTSANKISENAQNENLSQYQVDDIEGNIYSMWENELNCIYEQLQKSLPNSEFSTLQQEQDSWISSANEGTRKYAESYSGNGSDYAAVFYMKLGEYYKTRCYYLVDTYM